MGWIVKVKKVKSAYHVELVIDRQRFRLYPDFVVGEAEKPKVAAEWYARQLRKAMMRVA